MLKVVALVGIDGEKETGVREVEIERQRRPRGFKNDEFLGGVTLDYVGTDFRPEGDGDATLQVNIPDGWDVWAQGKEKGSLRGVYAHDMLKSFLAGGEFEDLGDQISYPLMVPKRSEDQRFTRLAIMERKEGKWKQRSMIEIRHT